jgi:hypothetical protein
MVCTSQKRGVTLQLNGPAVQLLVAPGYYIIFLHSDSIGLVVTAFDGPDG